VLLATIFGAGTVNRGSMFDLSEFRNRTLPLEREVTSKWQGDLGQPVVSVLCNTFNHEAYIEDAIRGFLIQRTQFPFEIIIHDDASTDNNIKIIKEYAEQYPKIIKLVSQDVNQYSQGKKPTALSFQYARGKYIALCEGDDFWVNPEKLQFQCDLLDSKGGVDGCAHAAFAMNANGEVKLINYYDASVLACNEVCKTGGGVVPTASLFLRRIVVERFCQLFEDAPLGDYFIQALAAESEGLAYEPKAASVYRLGTGSSVSNAEKRKAPDQMERFAFNFSRCLDRLDLEFRGEHRESIMYFKASMYKEAAIRALVYGKDEKLFGRLIELSSGKMTSFNHCFVFIFRRLPWVLSVAYKFRDKARRIISRII